jgi:hypothetical protein
MLFMITVPTAVVAQSGTTATFTFANDAAVLHKTGDEVATGTKTVTQLGINPSSGKYGGFRLNGRHGAGMNWDIAVPYVVPEGGAPDQYIAFDLLTKGTPVDMPEYGVSWIDITTTNEEKLALGQCESLRVGKHLAGAGYVSVDSDDVTGCSGWNPHDRPLLLQTYGGNVGIGPDVIAPREKLDVGDGNVIAGGYKAANFVTTPRIEGITDTRVVTNLNADMVGGKHVTDFASLGAAVPTHKSDACTAGSIASDDKYLYYCYASGNWKRIASTPAAW